MPDERKDQIDWYRFVNNIGGVNRRFALFRTPAEDALKSLNMEPVSGGFKKANGITRYVECPLLASGTKLGGTAKPDAETDAWTGAGDADTSASVSGGILTINEDGGGADNSRYYQDEAGFLTTKDAAFETRMKVQDGGTLDGVYAYSICVLDDATDRLELVAIESGGTKYIAVLTDTADRTLLASYSSAYRYAWSWDAYTRYRVSWDADGNVSVYVKDLKTAAITIAVSALPASTEASTVAFGSWEADTESIADIDYIVYKIDSLTLDTETITGLYDFELEDGTHKYIMSAGTKLYLYSSTVADWVEHTGGTAITDGAKTFFSVGREDTTGDKICIITTNARDAPQKTDGTTRADLGGSPPSGKYNALWNDRTWIGNVTGDPSAFYFSGAGNSEDDDINTGSWDTTNHVFIPDPGRFGAMKGFAPLISEEGKGNRMLVLYERGIKKITGWGLGSFMVEDVDINNGCIAESCIINGPFGQSEEEGVYFRDRDGWRYTQGHGSIAVHEKILNSIEDELNNSQSDEDVGFIDKARRMVGFSTPKGTDTTPSTSWVFDYFHGGRPSSDPAVTKLSEAWHEYDYAATAAAVWYEAPGRDRTVYGTTGGVVYKMDSGTDWDGSAFTGQRDTIWIDFGAPDRDHQVRYIKIFAKAVGDHNLTVEWYKDWDDTAVSSGTFNMVGGSFVLDSATMAILGTSRLGTVGAIKGLITPDLRCNALKLAFKTTGADEPFTIYGFAIGVQTLDVFNVQR